MVGITKSNVKKPFPSD